MRNDSTLREADQDDRTMPTVVPFERVSPTPKVQADNEAPPQANARGLGTRQAGAQKDDRTG